jgi:hypothetical protein
VEAIDERGGERRGGETGTPAEGEERVQVVLVRGRRGRRRVVRRRARHRLVRISRRGARGGRSRGEEERCRQPPELDTHAGR